MASIPTIRISPPRPYRREPHPVVRTPVLRRESSGRGVLQWQHHTRRSSGAARSNSPSCGRLREKPVAEISKDLGISESCLRNWMSQAYINEGRKEELTSEERQELVRLRRGESGPGDGDRDPQAGECLLRPREPSPKSLTRRSLSWPPSAREVAYGQLTEVICDVHEMSRGFLRPLSGPRRAAARHGAAGQAQTGRRADAAGVAAASSTEPAPLLPLSGRRG